MRGNEFVLISLSNRVQTHELISRGAIFISIGTQRNARTALGQEVLEVTDDQIKHNS